MKKAISIFLGFLCLALVVNCSAVGVQNREIQRQWMMISFKNFTKEQLVKSKSEINLTSAIKDGKIQSTAFISCNRMFFTAEIKSKNKIEFSGIGSTLMACENMKLEDEFSKELKKMKNYTEEGHFLTVTDNKGSIRRFIAADWD